MTSTMLLGMSVEKWRSRKTGLTVLWANFDSPLLNCYMTLASEIFEDSGVPHTLEHLIFLGSDLYPFKVFSNTLANRAFASGTNAWTANDHTAYTLTTADPMVSCACFQSISTTSSSRHSQKKASSQKSTMSTAKDRSGCRIQ